jgi:hypothetical protein
METGFDLHCVADYLFVPASGEAFGAENYFAGYRVTRPEKVDLATGTSNAAEVVAGTHETSVGPQSARLQRSADTELTRRPAPAPISFKGACGR